MPRFGSQSRAVLAQLDPRLAAVLVSAIKVLDFSLLAVHGGDPKKVEVAPWPVAYPALIEAPPGLWRDAWAKEQIERRERFVLLGGLLVGVAHGLGYRVRWGGDPEGTGTPTVGRGGLALVELVEG